MKKNMAARIVVLLLICAGGLFYMFHTAEKSENGIAAVPTETAMTTEENREMSPLETTGAMEETVATEETLEENDLDNFADPPANTNPPIIVDTEHKSDEVTDLDKYNKMSAEEQKEFIESFESVDAFLDWYEEAERNHSSSNQDIIVDNNTNLDFGG